MDAGRELDIRIAEKVMGLVVVARDWPCEYDPECGDYQARYTLYPEGAWMGERGPVSVPDGGTWPPVETSEADFARLGTGFTRADLVGTDWVLPHAHVLPIPFYSTDIAAAWAVVEHLRAQGWYLGLEVDQRVWYVRFNRTDGTARHGVGVTVPLALCRAALEAMP